MKRQLPFVLDQHVQKLDSEPKSFLDMYDTQVLIVKMPNPMTKIIKIMDSY